MVKHLSAMQETQVRSLGREGPLEDINGNPLQHLGLPWWLSGKESACNVGDPSLVTRLGRSSGEENGNPLQYSCLENSMDRGAWRAIVHGVTKESDVTEQLRLL